MNKDKKNSKIKIETDAVTVTVCEAPQHLEWWHSEQRHSTEWHLAEKLWQREAKHYTYDNKKNMVFGLKSVHDKPIELILLNVILW